MREETEKKWDLNMLNDHKALCKRFSDYIPLQVVKDSHVLDPQVDMIDAIFSTLTSIFTA